MKSRLALSLTMLCSAIFTSHAFAGAAALLGATTSSIYDQDHHKKHRISHWVKTHPLTSIAIAGVGVSAAGITSNCSKPENKNNDTCDAFKSFGKIKSGIKREGATDDSNNNKECPADYPYGPYYRYELKEELSLQLASTGWLYGTTPRGGDYPTVQAYALP